MAGGFSASSVVSLSSFGCSGAVSAAGEKADMHSDKYLELQFTCYPRGALKSHQLRTVTLL